MTPDCADPVDPVMSSKEAESDGVFVLFTFWAPKVMEGWSFSYFGPQKCGSVGRFHILGPQGWQKGLTNHKISILGYKKKPCGNDNGREGLGTNLVPSEYQPSTNLVPT